MCRFTYRSWIGPFIFFVPSFFKEEFQKEIKGSMCFSKKISFPSQVRVRQSKSIVLKHISWFALPKGIQIVSLYDISKYNKPLEWCCVSKLKRYLPEKRLEMCWQFEFKGMSCDSYLGICVFAHTNNIDKASSQHLKEPQFSFALQCSCVCSLHFGLGIGHVWLFLQSVYLCMCVEKHNTHRQPHQSVTNP